MLFLLIGLFGSSNKVRASFYLFLYTLTQQCKRAKHRETPKALVTKVVKEILPLAWLMPQGMVKSLEMRKKIFSKWATAVLNYPFWCGRILSCVEATFLPSKREHAESPINIYKDVKEQRVDGWSRFRYFNLVRCTLIAGKPVLGRTIHPSSHNNSKMYKYGLRAYTTSNKQQDNTLHPWFVTGLTDAEGTFVLGFRKSTSYKMGYQITGMYKIAMHKKDHHLLYSLQNFFGVGKITNHGETTLQYTVKSLAGLQIIISHFDKYPLLSEKWGDYKLFKEGIELLKIKSHLNKEGFHKILSIRATLNLGFSRLRRDELKLSFPHIIPVKRPLVKNLSITDYNWIAGLTSGDGCFYVYLRNSLTTKSVAGGVKSVTLKFHIVQHSRDIELIKLLIYTLKCGRVELNLKQSAVYFVVTNFKDIFVASGAKINTFICRWKRQV